jgi:hypothetical protein
MEQPNYQQSAPPSTPPKNWLVESILVTIFCCLPFGIAGIVFASQVNSKWSTGDFAGAQQSSKEAARWTKIGFWIGVGLNVLGILWIVFMGGLAILAGRHSMNSTY